MASRPLSAKSTLGARVAEYEIRRDGLVKVLAIMLATLGIGGEMIWFSVSTRDSNIGGRVVFFVLGLLFLLPSAFGVYGLARARKNTLYVHERGLVIHKSGERFVVPFDDIDSYSCADLVVIETKDDDSFEFGLSEANTAALLDELRQRKGSTGP